MPHGRRFFAVFRLPLRARLSSSLHRDVLRATEGDTATETGVEEATFAATLSLQRVMDELQEFTRVSARAASPTAVPAEPLAAFLKASLAAVEVDTSAKERKTSSASRRPNYT